MNLTAASVVDILRCLQKDNFILEKLQSSVSEILKIFGDEYRHQNKIKKVSTVLYFLLTSCSGLQTFGEEYTGTIRFNGRTKKLPSKLTHLLWLVFYVTGENIFNKILSVIEDGLEKSESLTEESKNVLMNCLIILKTNKQAFIRLHTALFYIRGEYYHITNYIFGIRYILLRQWYQNNNYSESFKFLGRVLFLYLSFYLFLYQIKNGKIREKCTQQPLKESKTSREAINSCLICSENRKCVVTTFCGHLFCWDCIQNSLLYQEVCPICRESINPNKIIMLQNFS